MSEALEARAETLKLARLLRVPEEELAFLAPLTAAERRELREVATDRAFSSGGLAKVGAAAKLLPSGLVATIAQRVFGPLLCARAAGAVDPAKAVDVSRRLPPPFLADVACELDPRRVAPIIAQVPGDLVVAVARILGERDEHVTMGRFLAYVPDRSIAAAIGALSDEALLRTAFVLEHKDRLSHAVTLLPSERLPGIFKTASAADLWPEGLDLLDHLSDEVRRPIADAVAAEEPEVIAGLVAAVSAAGIWDALLPIVRLMSPGPLKRLASVPAFHDDAVLAEIIDAASEPGAGLWKDLAPLVAELPPEAHGRAARHIGTLPEDRMAAAIRDAAAFPEALPPLLSLAAELDEPAIRRVAAAIETVAAEDRDALEAIVRAIGDDTTPAAVTVIRVLDPSLREELARRILPALEPLPPELAEVVAQLRAEGILP